MDNGRRQGADCGVFCGGSTELSFAMLFSWFDVGRAVLRTLRLVRSVGLCYVLLNSATIEHAGMFSLECLHSFF